MKWLFLIMVVGAMGLAKRDDHDPKNRPAPGRNRADERAEGACLNGGQLAAIANGVSSDLPGLVNYLSNADCLAGAPVTSQNALAAGVTFNETPYRLKDLANGLDPLSVESVERVTASLESSFPLGLKDHPLRGSEAIPVLGQVTVLSQRYGRELLGALVRDELQRADQAITRSPRGAEAIATDLARQLFTMGANTPLVSQELAKLVEEMALGAQADSLGKTLRSLGAVSGVEPTFAPTFEGSLGATRRGVEKGGGFYSPAEREEMMAALFSVVSRGLASETSNPGSAEEMNRSFEALLQGKDLADTRLRTIWREVLTALTTTRAQHALAKAFGVSLTAELVFLDPADRTKLISASDNYPLLAHYVQKQIREAASLSKARKGRFAGAGVKFFRPWVQDVLTLDPNVLWLPFLSWICDEKLILDSEVEAVLPKVVLRQLKDRQAPAASRGGEGELETHWRQSASNLFRSWYQAQAEVPELMRWVEQFNARKPTSE